MQLSPPGLLRALRVMVCADMCPMCSAQERMRLDDLRGSTTATSDAAQEAGDRQLEVRCQRASLPAIQQASGHQLRIEATRIPCHNSSMRSPGTRHCRQQCQAKHRTLGAQCAG